MITPRDKMQKKSIPTLQLLKKNDFKSKFNQNLTQDYHKKSEISFIGK